jgi:hypothetical protein
MEEDTNNSRAHMTCLAMFQFNRANYNHKQTSHHNPRCGLLGRSCYQFVLSLWLEGMVINLHFHGLHNLLNIQLWIIPPIECFLALSVPTTTGSIVAQQSPPFEDPPAPIHLNRLRHISVETYVHFCNYTSYIWSISEFVSFFCSNV